MEVRIDPRFKSKLQLRFDKQKFEVGILEDGPHREARRGVRGLGGKDVLSTYAGGAIRKRSRIDSGKTISEVSRDNSKRLGFNYLSKPFQSPDSDILRFAKEFLRLAFGRSSVKRCENLLQAIVRNPILRGEYGTESRVTKAIKGFSRPMIDTAQLFRAIKARGRVGR